MGILDAYKQKKLAKQLAPIIKRYKEIDNMFNLDLEINQSKTLSVELADKFIEVVQICGKYGFPKADEYVRVYNGLKNKIKATEDEDILSNYINYLLSNFDTLIKKMGIAI